MTRSRRIAALPAAIAAWIALCAVVGSWSGCTSPGEGQKAEAGYSAARPVIEALKKYRDQHKEYPTNLRDLVGQLAENDRKTPDGKAVAEFFEYEKSGAGYRLQFTYTGPGMNRCVYTPDASKWECAGHH